MHYFTIFDKKNQRANDHRSRRQAPLCLKAYRVTGGAYRIDLTYFAVYNEIKSFTEWKVSQWPCIFFVRH